MKFEEKLAAQIVKKHALSQSIIRQWRHKREIPDKYGDESFKVDKSDKISDALQKKMIDAVFQEAIVTKYLTSIDFRILLDAKRKGYKKIKLTENTVKLLRQEIVLLRNELRKFVNISTENNLKSIIFHPLIHHYVLFRGMRKMVERAKKNMSIYDEEIQEAKIKVAALYSSLKF